MTRLAAILMLLAVGCVHYANVPKSPARAQMLYPSLKLALETQYPIEARIEAQNFNVEYRRDNAPRPPMQKPLERAYQVEFDKEFRARVRAQLAMSKTNHPPYK